MQVDLLWDQLDTPVLLVVDSPWRIQWCNAKARSLLGTESGKLFQEIFENVDIEKLQKRLFNGRLAEFTVDTNDRLFQRVFFKLKQLGSTTILIEGHNDTRAIEAEAMSASYVKLVEQQKRQILREKEINELAHASLKKASELISQSISYASRIQQALLPSKEQLIATLGDLSVWWEPRDVVGGDLYWATNDRHDSFGSSIALFDCTGHGVPGAFMTALIVPLMDNIYERGLFGSPGLVLYELDKLVRRHLGQDSVVESTNDGLDMGICLINQANRTVNFSGAGIDLFQINRTYGAKRIKGSNQSIGYRNSKSLPPWPDHSIFYEQGDIFIMLTDGLTTQLGGPKNIAFGNRRTLDFFAQHQNSSPEFLMSELKQLISDWQGELERRDDITVLIFSPSTVD